MFRQKMNEEAERINEEFRRAKTMADQKRITNERLTEINEALKRMRVLDDTSAGYFGGVGPIAKDLFDALKAERAKVAELEALIKEVFGHPKLRYIVEKGNG